MQGTLPAALFQKTRSRKGFPAACAGPPGAARPGRERSTPGSLARNPAAAHAAIEPAPDFVPIGPFGEGVAKILRGSAPPCRA